MTQVFLFFQSSQTYYDILAEQEASVDNMAAFVIYPFLYIRFDSSCYIYISPSAFIHAINRGLVAVINFFFLSPFKNHLNERLYRSTVLYIYIYFPTIYIMQLFWSKKII